VNKSAIILMLAVVVLGASTEAAAQVKWGDFSVTGTEGLSVGYSDQYGDVSSAHGLAWGSQTTLSGSYYNPQFLNFTVVPYFNQSRANSDSASVSDASGVSAAVNLFSGSRMPVSVGYNFSNDSLSNYSLGQAAFTTHGTSDTFSVSSSLKLDKLPNLMFMYQQGDTNSELYGNSQEVTTDFHIFRVNTAGYRLAGFMLQGGYQMSWGDTRVPELFANPDLSTNTSSGYQNSSRSFNASASHDLGSHGGVGIGYDHETFDEHFDGGYNAGSINLLNGNVTEHPTEHLQFVSNTQFNDNLEGVMQQNIIAANGGVAVLRSDGERSNSLVVTNTAIYTPIRDVGFSGSYVYAQQVFRGVLYNTQSLDGEVSYAHKVYDGNLRATFGVTEDLRGFNQLGYRLLSGWSRRFGAWNVNLGFNYNHSQRSMLLEYTTSGYNYSGSVGRKLGFFQWSVGAAAAKAKFDQLGTAANTAQTYSMNFSAKYASVGGSYNKSSGNSFLTPTGLTTTDLPPGVLGPEILYNASSYSISGTMHPTRVLEVDGSYLQARSATLNGTLGSSNSTSETFLRLRYRFRKLSFNAGYTQFNQAFSASSTGASSFTSIFFGLQRWFNFM